MDCQMRCAEYDEDDKRCAAATYLQYKEGSQHLCFLMDKTEGCAKGPLDEGRFPQFDGISGRFNPSGDIEDGVFQLVSFPARCEEFEPFDDLADALAAAVEAVELYEPDRTDDSPSNPRCALKPGALGSQLVEAAFGWTAKIFAQGATPAPGADSKGSICGIGKFYELVRQIKVVIGRPARRWAQAAQGRGRGGGRYAAESTTRQPRIRRSTASRHSSTIPLAP